MTITIAHRLGCLMRAVVAPTAPYLSYGTVGCGRPIHVVAGLSGPGGRVLTLWLRQDDRVVDDAVVDGPCLLHFDKKLTDGLQDFPTAVPAFGQHERIARLKDHGLRPEGR